MDIKLLSAYLIRNSTQATRNKSFSIYPDLVKITANGVKFEYQGTNYIPYEISIKNEGTLIKTQCSCPFDYAGICKHTVAAIRELISKLKNGTISFNNIENEVLELLPTLPDIPKNQLHLPNKEITKEVIKQLSSLHKYRYYDEIKITHISPSTIESKSGWHNYSQTLNFNKNNNILTFNCNCSTKNVICEHSSSALLQIYKLYGEDFFKDNFLDNIKTKHLAQYNLTLQDNYQKYFTYELTPKGVAINSPFKNIKNTVTKFNVFDSETTELLAMLPHKNKKDEATGLGFVFEFGRKSFSDLLPVKAKYNKDKSDFASSFKVIGNYDADEELYEIENEEEQDLVVKTNQFNYLQHKYDSYKNIKILKRGIKTLTQLTPKLATHFLYEHKENKSLIRKNLTPLTLVNQPIKLFFTLTESDLFYTLKAKVCINETNYNLDSSGVLISTFFIKIKDIVYTISDADLSATLSYFKKESEINYVKTNFSEVYNKIILPLSKKYEIQSSIIKKSTKKTAVVGGDDKLEKHIYMTDLEGEYVLFKPIVSYDGKLIPVFSNELLVTTTNANSIQFTERNQAFEDNFLEELRNLHTDFLEQEHFFFLTPEQLFENYWMLHATERMKQLGIKVFGANELKSFKYNLNKPTINVSLKSEIDWFDIAINVSFGDQKVALKDIQKSIIKKSNYVTLGDGTIGILPEEWMKKFTSYFRVGEIKKDSIQLSNYQFGIIDELYQELETKPAFLEELYQKKKRLQHISSIENVVVPKEIKATLREYQQHGLNWLTFLDTNRLGGCLADDMGLGKTLQTIAFLMHLKKNNKKLPATLIIAPTSLIFNWKNELDKFAPSLKATLFVGNNRKDLQHTFSEVDVVISTYGSLLNDIVFLQEYNFHYVILDESQAIKNPQSKRYKAVRLLKAHNRLVLTGTPIENNTFDLYAQLNFLNPGLLGSMNHFKTEFSNAIDKEKDIDASKLLSTIVSPFILRRTKEQVATELPEKTEEIIYCEMPKEQRNVYELFKNKYRDYLLNKIEENGAEKSQMYVLEGLTKLRQICNSTALINDEEDYGNYSVKLETLIETIKEKTGKHKILVFSQFVKMLQLIKTRLEDEKVEYEYLDGQTTNREEKVNNFQTNTDVRVFLISLKAGGTGLNLTQADYVFIVDPWWNPAVENQAIDRCYRIGQSKKVMAYRMICKDTIEEKIMSLQQKKRTVASNVVQIDDTKKSFDAKQIKALFS